jgi:plasmid stability protein
MASITIRRLEDSVKERLRMRASRHGRSMEEEARDIFNVAVNTQESGQSLWDSIRRRVEPFGGIEFRELPRELVPEPPTFD